MSPANGTSAVDAVVVQVARASLDHDLRRVCEASRTLLGQCLVSSLLDPQIWTIQLARSVETAFVMAIAATSSDTPYRKNVRDRACDFVILHRLDWFKMRQHRQSPLLRFNVAARNLQREFDRECEPEIEPSNDAQQALSELVHGCEAMYHHLSHDQAKDSPQWQRASGAWTRIGQILKEIVHNLKTANIKDAVAQCRESIRQIFPEIEEVGHKVSLPARPVSSITWTMVLPHAAYSCEAFARPDRESLATDEDVVFPMIQLRREHEIIKQAQLHYLEPRLEELEQEVQAAAKELNIRTKPQLEELREDLLLSHEYPGQHVAFVDTWTFEGKRRTLRREVVASGLSQSQMEQQLMHVTLTKQERRRLRKMMIDDPKDAILDRHFVDNPD